MLPSRRIILQRIQTPSALLGGGVLLGLSYPPFPFPLLAGIALVPVLLRWNHAIAWRRMLLDAYVYFLAASAVAFSWPLLHVFPHTALASLNGILLLPLLMAAPFAGSVSIRRRLGRTAGLVSLVALYLAMELIMSRGPWAFPWPLLGHALSEALLLNQFADLAGVPGLTLWILLANVFTLVLLESRAGHRGSTIAAVVTLLAVPVTYSLWRQAHLARHEQAIHVGVVQPAIGPQAWADVQDHSRVDTLLHLTDTLLAQSPDLDLVIWPETTLPPLYPVHDRPLQTLANRSGTPLLTGAITPAGSSAYYNSALLFTPDNPVQRYDKHHLVPFAERVPFVNAWPALKRLAIPAGGVTGYRPGRGQPLLETSTARFGVLICLESLFGDYARRYVAEGADVLVTLTQDGWWGRSFGYRQHLAFTRLRAIETRRAVVQVSVTGTSALILPDGSTAFQTGWMERTAFTARVPVLSASTFYTRHGDWLSYAACMVAALLVAAALLPDKQRSVFRGLPSPVEQLAT